jgi:hypothetical protein
MSKLWQIEKREREREKHNKVTQIAIGTFYFSK